MISYEKNAAIIFLKLPRYLLQSRACHTIANSLLTSDSIGDPAEAGSCRRSFSLATSHPEIL